MKPLHVKDIESFLSRFGDFLDAEIRNIDVISPQEINITLACQDSARAFDWITLTLGFSSVSDASLIDASQLPHVDTSEGATIIYEDGYFIFSIKNATLSVTASTIKYEEGLF